VHVNTEGFQEPQIYNCPTMTWNLNTTNRKLDITTTWNLDLGMIDTEPGHYHNVASQHNYNMKP